MKENGGSKHAPQQRSIDPQLVESAKRILFESQPQQIFACQVCHSPEATEQSEGLCWVCRRLKISAWSESEQQMMFTE